MEFRCRNVNDAFRTLVGGIHSGRIPTVTRASRYGEVQTVEEPVTVTYERPRERVLFNAARDANPFFHLMESLWMLAGRNDVAPLAYYCSRMREFSDDGTIFNGAYGWRWRNNPRRNDDDEYEYGAVDQLDLLAAHLKKNPHSRRAVLSMWNVEDDLFEIDTSKDVCCNLAACFAVRLGDCPECEGRGFGLTPHGPSAFQEPAFSSGKVVLDPIPCYRCRGKPHEVPVALDMTVFNRSNDLIWGLLGANAVHFSVLQEYMAAALGLEVGVYHQVSNNVHVYAANWKPEEWLKDGPYPPWEPQYTDGFVHFPFMKDRATFDREVRDFVERHSRDAMTGGYKEPFLDQVAEPMCIAFHHYNRGELTRALWAVRNVQALDWRDAGTKWLERRAAWRSRKEAGHVGE